MGERQVVAHEPINEGSAGFWNPSSLVQRLASPERRPVTCRIVAGSEGASRAWTHGCWRNSIPSEAWLEAPAAVLVSPGSDFLCGFPCVPHGNVSATHAPPKPSHAFLSTEGARIASTRNFGFNAGAVDCTGGLSSGVQSHIGWIHRFREQAGGVALVGFRKPKDQRPRC